MKPNARLAWPSATSADLELARAREHLSLSLFGVSVPRLVATHDQAPDGVATVGVAATFGTRTLFVCPSCSRRCRDLFAEPDLAGAQRRWRCRVCAGLQYETAATRLARRESARALNDAARIAAAHPGAASRRRPRRHRRARFAVAAREHDAAARRVAFWVTLAASSHAERQLRRLFADAEVLRSQLGGATYDALVESYTAALRESVEQARLFADGAERAERKAIAAVEARVISLDEYRRRRLEKPRARERAA